MYNFMFRMSIFTDTQDLQITPDRITIFMNALNNKGAEYIPSIINEQTLIPQLQTNRRLQFLWNNITIRMLGARIDVEQPFETEIKEATSKPGFSDEMLHGLKVTLELLSKRGSRLALSSENIIQLGNEEKLNAFLARNNYGMDMLIPPFFAWNNEVTIRRILTIGGKEEECNIVIKLIKGGISKIGSSDSSQSRDGLIIVTDINTMQENTDQRFTFSDYLDFYREAIELQKNICLYFDTLDL
ncbi:MAG: hypothetical protein ABFC73_04975 [Clostridiaceae bacterium]